MSPESKTIDPGTHAKETSLDSIVELHSQPHRLGQASLVGINGPEGSSWGSNQSHPSSPHFNSKTTTTTTTNFPNTKIPLLFINNSPNCFSPVPLQETDFPRQCPPKVRFPNLATPQFPHKTHFFTQHHFS